MDEIEQDERRRSTNATARALSEQYLADLDGDPHDGLADRALRDYADALRTTAAGAAADERARLDALDRWLARYADRGATRAAIHDDRAAECICSRLGAGPEQLHTRCHAEAHAVDVDDSYEPDDDPFYAAFLVDQERGFATGVRREHHLGPDHDPYGATCERTRGHLPAPHAGPHPLGSPGALLVWTGGGTAGGDPLPFRIVATLIPRPDRGAWYEDGDRDGTVGKLWAPMLDSGLPDLDNLGEIEVRWEDA